MNVYFVRHGKTVWNLEARLQGWADSPLLEDDNSHILAAEKLKGLSFDYICSSDLKRAIVTKEKILKILNLKDDKNEHPEFKEFGYGVLEGEFLSVVLEKYGDIWRQYKLYREDFDPGLYIEGFESIRKLKERVYKKLDELKSIYGQDANILIISHGSLISIIQNDKITLTEPVHIPDNGSVTKVIY